MRVLTATAGMLRVRLTLFVAALTVQAAAGVTVPALLAAASDAVLGGRGTGAPVAALAAVLAAGAAAEAVVVWSSVAIGAVGTARLRMLTLRRLLALGPRSPFAVGEAVTQVAQAAPQAAALPGHVAEASVSVAGSAAALVALWLVDWRAGLAFTLLVPVTVLAARRFVTEAAEVEGRYLAAQTRMASLLAGALTGARTIRAAGTLAAETRRVAGPLHELSAAGHASWRVQRSAVWKIGLLVPGTEIVVLAVAGVDVSAGLITAGNLLAVAGYLALATGLLDQIDTALSLAQARAGADRLDAVLQRPAVPGGPRSIPPPDGAVSLRGVTVVRAGGRVLDRLDLEIPDGVAVALVGASGSGKSVLGALLGRLADPDEGAVHIGGVDITDLDLPALRRTVTYAFARPALAGRTLHEAIRLGRPELDRVAVESAARAARIHHVIRRLPAGYDSVPARTPMSGGQLQRVGLARALVRPALVHVLDDATSGLDSVTEREVSEAVTARLHGRTRVVVTHRADTAACCDLVAWLDAGRVRALAPHARLWADPRYRAVFETVAVPSAATDREQPCAADR
ncbi:Lipid A export ATP-binding/permease protein msbA [Actinoplanes sp. SE50]|uniref:ABC transporter ATP-binding protein n=1 Tax=unclassified Actinoplanes TaxID=2626549 RepID=UPI00023ECB55|nr:MULTISPECIES: ABC transporter ATP-binding protein [unclassified Actinoplanes]AEV85423.1 Lipid A export ATP-binding/permease protein msbA [Actinoplanes sp. SE50/110]ATO83818.1 Lipid A export ATP-binding/permease protein msbA [Actinoplanes sp. SE50]SLM01226.1 Lipid A export ATP-binding/permease protein msbA [Actinoplanes sp. SE50/110]